MFLFSLFYVFKSEILLTIYFNQYVMLQLKKEMLFLCLPFFIYKNGYISIISSSFQRHQTTIQLFETLKKSSENFSSTWLNLNYLIIFKSRIYTNKKKVNDFISIDVTFVKSNQIKSEQQKRQDILQHSFFFLSMLLCRFQQQQEQQCT